MGRKLDAAAAKKDFKKQWNAETKQEWNPIHKHFEPKDLFDSSMPATWQIAVPFGLGGIAFDGPFQVSVNPKGLAAGVRPVVCGIDRDDGYYYGDPRTIYMTFRDTDELCIIPPRNLELDVFVWRLHPPMVTGLIPPRSA